MADDTKFILGAVFGWCVVLVPYCLWQWHRLRQGGR